MTAAMMQHSNPSAGGELLINERLTKYTSWRVGGPADRLYKAVDLNDLSLFLCQLPATEPLFWLGLGSNVLVRDGGIRGTVIATQGALQNLMLKDQQLVRAEAGVPCAKVARFAARHDLCGVEFLAGIPGLLGGALAMNAGAWGGDTWSWVDSVETIDRHGVIRQRSAADYEVGYRRVQGPAEEWFVAAYLRLEAGDGSASLIRIRELLDRRAQTQPTGVASCGSVFRNPPGGFAAQLIEMAGLKGARQGAACVSTKHANFIINTGSATALDIECLIQQVTATVQQLHGVLLRPEVRIVGEFLDQEAGSDVV